MIQDNDNGAGMQYCCGIIVPSTLFVYHLLSLYIMCTMVVLWRYCFAVSGNGENAVYNDNGVAVLIHQDFLSRKS